MASAVKGAGLRLGLCPTGWLAAAFTIEEDLGQSCPKLRFAFKGQAINSNKGGERGGGHRFLPLDPILQTFYQPGSNFQD